MKTVTELILTPFQQPHPYKLHFVAQYRFVHQVAEFLVRRDQHKNLTGGLAHSWAIAEDRLSIIFHLRPGLYSAEEVCQSLSRLIKRNQTSHSNLASQIISIEEVNCLSVRIVTKGDAATILSPLVMADAAILPDSHWVKMNGFQEEQVDWTKTKGPYIYKSGIFPPQDNGELLFVPNPEHYLYQEDQVAWKLRTVPLASIQSLQELSRLLRAEPSFTTIRYSNFLRIFSTADPGMLFYQTKPNGVAFIQLNPAGSTFKDRAVRRTLLKKLFSIDFEPLIPHLRAFQIAHPGLENRLSDSTGSLFQTHLKTLAEAPFSKPIRWSLPSKAEENTEWHRELVKQLNLPVTFVMESVYPFQESWKSGDVDATFLSVGMSDTDPISGATFLFSASGSRADLPDGKIMQILNGVKNEADFDIISTAVREAFKIALEEAIILPLYYTVNRHYYSEKVSLNISDPFSESVEIWKVRLISS